MNYRFSSCLEQKIKYFLIVIGLSSIFSDGYSSKITKILAKKRILIIDFGKNEGVKKGSKICVFDDKIGKKIICGKAIKVKKNKSYVRVKSIQKLKKGMQVGLSKTTSKTSSKKKKFKKTKISKKTSFLEKPSLFKIYYLLTPIAVSTFNNLKYIYEPSNNGQTYTSLWNPVSVANSSFVGVGGDYEKPMGNHYFALGLKYKLYTSPQFKFGSYIYADYGDDKNNYVYIEQTASAIDFYADYLYLNFMLSKNLIFKFGNGLDYNISSVKLAATNLNDQDPTINNKIYSGTSTLNTISLRTVANFYLMFGRFGLGAGGTLLIPISASLKQSFETNDQYENTLSSGTAKEDVTKSLNHKKNGFGLEINFSTFIAF